MANTNLSLVPQNFPVTVNMLVVLKGAEKMDTEMRGLRGKVAAFKKSMEDSGLEPLDVAGFISEGGLLKPFQDGIKKAIEAQDALAKKVMANKGLKLPKVVQGETSANLAKFNEALDRISLNIGNALLPAVNGIVTAITPVITSIGQFVANNPYLVEGLAAAAVAFTVVTVSAMGMVAVLGILTSPIGLIAATIAAAVALIVIGARLITNNWGAISGFFSHSWQTIGDATRRGIDSVQKGWGEMVANGKLRFESMRASALLKWQEMRADAIAGASAMAAGASERLRAFGAFIKQTWDSARSAVGAYWDSAAATTAAGLQTLGARLYTSPLERLSALWDSADEAVTGYWSRSFAATQSGWESVKSTFDGTLTAKMAGVWESARGAVADAVGSMQSVAASGWEQLKSMFSWSPTAMVESAWQPLAPVFSALWDVLQAGAQPLKNEFKNLFGSAPVEAVMAKWNGVTEYFSSLWTTLNTDAQSVKTTLGELFNQSPLESIKEKWQPVLGWFSDMWASLQEIFGQVKELLGGNFSGFFATITATSAAAPAGAPGLSSTLPQTSGALIQQSALNNRTQLEGGLTVSFENAPAGLRTHQPQTNQPGLALTSRIGYRSLSIGGSNELA
ncbi:hypothetical protein [Pseudomonas moraviensis]|uniref:hypothetical protein n=1 Tax=Pseudomonas moraviensis TaxID=321662 RepID=UPI0010597E55|nr:hypothetical protein E1508_02220 [Pseudomonas moraviensis]